LAPSSPAFGTFPAKPLSAAFPGGKGAERRRVPAAGSGFALVQGRISGVCREFGGRKIQYRKAEENLIGAVVFYRLW